MKKKFGILMISAFLTTGATVYASPQTYTSDIDGEKICANEIVNELIKQTIYQVGTRVLDKMANPNGGSYYNNNGYNYNNNYNQQTTTTNTSSSTNTGTNTSTTTTTQSEITEQLIPI